MAKVHSGRVVLNSIGVMSLAKFEAVFMLIFGIPMGIIYAALNLAGFGLMWVIVLPIGYGLLGFIIGAITAVIYRWIAGWLGGIEFEYAYK